MIWLLIIIAFLFFLVGFVVTYYFLKKKNIEYSSNQTLFSTFINDFKEKQIKKKKEKEFRNQLLYKAKLDAMKTMYPEYVKQMKEKERKIISGEDKREKMQKFAYMFSMNTDYGNDKNSNNKKKFEDKINDLLK